MAVTTHSFKYKPTTAPSGIEDRVLACSHITDDCHCVINSSGQIGYYVSGVFTQMGTATVSLNEQYAFIIEHDDAGNGCIYLNGQKIGCATNFPTSAINQIGNFKTELKPETGRKPKVGLKPRAVSNIYTRPCCGIIDEYARFDRALSASEVVDLSQSGTLSKVYTLADYKIALMADDGIIATTEKPRYKENWRSIWDADQRTSALPTAIASITVNGSYKSLATAANDAGIWTPTTNGTPAYDYYQAVESWRQMYFVSSGGGTGFLLTANLAGDTDISAMSPTLEARQSALMFAEDALRSAVMIKRQSTAELTAVANANAYTDELEDALRSQTDHAIVFTTSASDPSTGWTAEEKLIHKGDYWRVNTSSAWKTWTGTTWGTVNDAQAQAAATLAQSVANSKTTLYGTLSSAELAAKTGDQFFYNSEIYVCTADLAATARRYTTKSYGNSATAPVQTTQTVSGSVLTEPLNFGDTYFNTTTKKFYTYTTAWVEDTATSNAVIAYAPKYLGRYYQSHPGAPNNGDWWLVYGLASSPVTRGFWYNNNGTNTLVSTLGTEAQRKYKGSGLEDVLYASNNGYALTSVGVYDPVTIYGVSTMEFLAVNQAFIEKLMTRELELQSGGKLFSGGGNYGNADTPIFIGDDGGVAKFSLGEKLKYNGSSLDVDGHLYSQGGSFDGNVYLNSGGVIQGKDALRNQTYIGRGLIAAIKKADDSYWSPLGTTTVGDKWVQIESGKVSIYDTSITSSPDPVAIFDEITQCKSVVINNSVSKCLRNGSMSVRGVYTSWVQRTVRKLPGNLDIIHFESFSDSVSLDFGRFGFSARLYHPFSTTESYYSGLPRIVFEDIYSERGLLTEPIINANFFYIDTFGGSSGSLYQMLFRNVSGNIIYASGITVGEYD